MIRADVFDRLGGFDEAFWPAWWEDVDFCRRLLATGHRIRYVPDAVFLHQGGASLEALGTRTFERVFAANRRRYVRKHHGRLAAALVGGLGIAGAALRGVGRVVRRGR